MLNVSLLGDFRIRHDDVPVTGLDTPRLQSLLAILLLNRHAPQSRAHLAFLFWPDTSEAQARTNLRNLLHHLRHALPDAHSYLDAGPQTLQWRPDAAFTLDVADFQTAMARAERTAQAGHPAAGREALEQAVALYSGDLLPSCYDDWVIPLREGLRQSYLSALERLSGLFEEQRDYPAAIRCGQRLLGHDPVHEAAYRRLIRLHALDGDRAGALRLYHTCTTILRRELDVEPSAATLAVYEQLLGAEPRPSPSLPAPGPISPLVGRVKEWGHLLRAWRAAAAGGQCQIVVLRGEAGIGKTRLVEDLLQWAARQGIATAYTRCYAAEGELAYAPVATWLRAHPLPPLEDVWLAEVARLLPEVLARRPDLSRPAAMTEAWERQHLFEALSLAIMGSDRPLLLAIDDLQWCDRDTLEWLHFLMRFNRDARLLVVAAYRPEEIGHGHPLVRLLNALRLEGHVTEVDLPSLDEADTRKLAEQVAGVEIGAGVSQLLYRETEGNPLFVVETVRAGLPLHSQVINAGAGRGTAPHPPAESLHVPPRVQAVLAARLAQISPPARGLAELAATIGRGFSFDLLAKASGRDEEALVRELDELWQRRIVREHGTDAYDFSHDKLREVAYGSMSVARRRLLHRQTAQALESLHAGAPDAVSSQLAAHYERAGLAEQAVPYCLRAAGVARQIFANEEAVTLLWRGLALLKECRTGAGRDNDNREVAARLWEELGDIHEIGAQHEEALQNYRQAQAHVPNEDRLWQARLHRKLNTVMREQRLYPQALEACYQAEAALGKLPGEDPGRWWAEWLEVQVERVWAHYWLAQWPEMDELVRKLQPVVEERGNPASRARFLMASCLLDLRKGRYVISDEMVANAREALALSREHGSPKTRLECQFELGFLHLWRRELDEAGENLQAALELAETAGIMPIRTLALTYLSTLSRFRGQTDEAQSCSARAREAAEAAHMPDYVAAAKANQAWVAWRGRDLPTAERLGREALAMWQRSPLVYPFQWQALWPLIGAAMASGREDEAWDCAVALLEPMQQRLPDALTTPLESAVQARASDRSSEARPHLYQAAEAAQELGYL